MSPKKHNEYSIINNYIIAKASNDNNVEFLIDIDDKWVLKEYCWRCHSDGYIVAKKDGHFVRLHRVIMDAKKGNMIDHINGDILDNRKCNLREVSNSQNSMNRRKCENNTSGVVGVSWDKSVDKWKSYIKINKKFIHLGNFDNIEDAIIARHDAEEKYFGEYSFNNSRNKS